MYANTDSGPLAGDAVPLLTYGEMKCSCKHRQQQWLIDGFLHLTGHKIGHIGVILPSQSLDLILKTKDNKTKQRNDKKTLR